MRVALAVMSPEDEERHHHDAAADAEEAREEPTCQSDRAEAGVSPLGSPEPRP